MKYIQKFNENSKLRDWEDFLSDFGFLFIPRLNKLKYRYKQQVSSFITKVPITESLSGNYIEENVKIAIDDFKKAIDIFNDIKIEYISGVNVGEYEFGSSLEGEPLIYLYIDTIKSLPEDEIVFAIRTTIFHELCHAMVDIDNNITFVEDENILQFEDEEEFCEEFAIDFEMLDKVPNEIIKLAKLFKKYQSI